MKRHTKRRIIATLLAMAIALTGITFSDTVTASAATSTTIIAETKNPSVDIQGTTVTVEVGKTVQFSKTQINYGISMNTTNGMDWTSSDENVVTLSVVNGQTAGGFDKVIAVNAYAAGEGTATVTGTSEAGTTRSFTIKVTAPKATAKQLKCKHSWKTTKKATCLRSGEKVCKKCKLRKILKKKAHSYTTEKREFTYYDHYPIYICNGCTCEDKSLQELHESPVYNGTTCPNMCGKTFDPADYDLNGDGHVDQEDIDAANDAMHAHQTEEKHGCLNWIYYEVDDLTTEKTYTKDVEYCKTCKYTKKVIEYYGY